MDQNNHVLSMHRYMWNDGWVAAEISQIVDVAPNETYSFSALAKGGIRSNGNTLGFIKIQDLLNDDNKVSLNVTSDDYQTYATDFETKANTAIGLARACPYGSRASPNDTGGVTHTKSCRTKKNLGSMLNFKLYFKHQPNSDISIFYEKSRANSKFLCTFASTI